MSYGPSIGESFKALAVFVDKVLKGADASRIPIEQARNIKLTVNLPAATALGLTVPQSIVSRADKLIV